MPSLVMVSALMWENIDSELISGLQCERRSTGSSELTKPVHAGTPLGLQVLH